METKAVVHRLTHLHVNVRLGRMITHIDGPTAVQMLLDIRPATDRPNAPPLDLRLVIDRSGSMKSAGKLDAVKAAMLAMVDDLDPKDRLTIITFEAVHAIDLPSTQMSPRGKDLARAVITNLQADGGTFISGAFEEAITRPDLNFETRIVLFTDGESTIDNANDHANLVRSSDRARQFELPIFIYGTGDDYNFALLQQIAARVGHGSFLKHVMDAEVLRDHVRAEIGFLRGVGVRGLTVQGSVPTGVTLTNVTRFMPQQSDIEILENGEFKDNSGALDRARGQQYLIDLLVATPQPGPMTVLSLELHGRSTAAGTGAFVEKLDIKTTFTENPAEQSPIDPDVRTVMLKMAAAKKATDGDFDGAAGMYTRAGDQATADAMRTMSQQVHHGHRTRADATRGATTMSRGSVSVDFTVPHPRDKESDT